MHCSVGVCRIAATRISGNRVISRNTDGGNGEDTRGGVDFDQCVKQADLALYETKRFNKGHFTVYNYDRPQPASAMRLGAAGKCEEDENHIKRNNQRNNYHINRKFHRTIHIVAH